MKAGRIVAVVLLVSLLVNLYLVALVVPLPEGVLTPGRRIVQLEQERAALQQELADARDRAGDL